MEILNCLPNRILDKKRGLLIPRKSVVTAIENLQEELDLVDIWRVKNPERKSFTWSKNSPMIFCRLDNCEFELETLLHLLCYCVYSRLFWKDFEFYFYSLSKEFVHLSLQDVLIGITTSEFPLLNYFLLIAKLYLWDCRRSQILPTLAGFKIKIKIKFETEKYICTKNKTLDQFRKKWRTFCPE